LAVVHEGGIGIEKKSNPLNPVQWNVLAIIFILGFMPFAVAFISNAGSSSDEVWINSMQIHDEPIPLTDDSIWIENGGSNLTSWYSTFNPPSNNDELDCAYITNGECEGYYDDSNPTDRLIKPLSSSSPLPYPNNAFISNDYFDVRSSQVTQSHFEPGHLNAYAGRSGNEVFSWYLSSKYNNEINQGETLDSLRYWMTSSTSYNCNTNLWANLTFEGEITFYYGNDTLTYSNFEFKTDNKFQYEVLDELNGDWDSVCAVGFFVEFDFTGFESLEINTFNSIGDWDNTSIKLTLKDFVNTDSPEDFGSTQLPFAGADYWNLGVQHREINPVEAGFLIKTGTLLLAVITLGVALASTPYWDPFRNFFKGMVE
tara:strand:+ start:407 stop:1516 length:1110 start_codon:yes stop_codon:yes gene_type:complete